MPVLMDGRDRSIQTALAFGWLGDIALLGKSKASFRLGLASFLAGHFAWVTVLRRKSSGQLRKRPLSALPYLGLWAGLNAYLWPRSGKEQIPVVIYSTALLATALAALDTGDLSIASGGALFLLSDALIALEKFADVQLPMHEGLVMATYTSAQGLLSNA